MTIHLIIFPEMELDNDLIAMLEHGDIAPEINDIIRGSIVNGEIKFILNDNIHEMDTMEFMNDMFTLVYAGQYIEYNGVDTYTFSPSNVSMTFDNSQQPGIISINSPTFRFKQQHRLDNNLDTLKAFLNKLIVKQQHSELNSVSRIGKNRNLPRNVDSVIGSFISGKKGYIPSQKNQLKQNMGISLAPRVKGRRTRKRAN
jgi:hypothetical protein